MTSRRVAKLKEYKRMVSNNNKNNNSWTPPLKITALGVGITLISVVWSIILGYKQISSK